MNFIFRLSVVFLAGYVLTTEVVPDRHTLRSELNWVQYSLGRDLGLDRIERALR